MPIWFELPLNIEKVELQWKYSRIFLCLCVSIPMKINFISICLQSLKWNATAFESLWTIKFGSYLDLFSYNFRSFSASFRFFFTSIKILSISRFTKSRSLSTLWMMVNGWRVSEFDGFTSRPNEWAKSMMNKNRNFVSN